MCINLSKIVKTTTDKKKENRIIPKRAVVLVLSYI